MKVYASWIAACILALGSQARAQSLTKKLAVVNGETITETQVLKAEAAELAKLDRNRPKTDSEYQREKLAIMWKGLNAILEDKLLNVEAKRDSMSKEELVQAEVDDNVQAPTGDIVEKFYEANQSRLPFVKNLPREEALAKVRDYMIANTRRKTLDSYIANLSRQYHVETYLDPLRSDIATAGFPTRGAAKALVTIVEFSDFECPYCQALTPTLSAIEKEYGDRLRVVYREFPLTYVHPHAEKAAEAALCAADQNRFWELHDALFANPKDLSVDALKRRAADLKLDAAAFNMCLDSGRQLAAINKDIDEGFRVGVTGTPTMFVNGRILYGNRPYAEIRAIIEDELHRPR